eukprot:TRINITY_DN2495_c0_g1_i1.p1 TRINITY_DN2495_c0_g1~~TRINITY_DN2495_c0_g1_i1.p1  ORF type:complete len:258 (+),score=81.94 TRINITY_DN2495_c0_g1_i1:173-946(+)
MSDFWRGGSSGAVRDRGVTPSYPSVYTAGSQQRSAPPVGSPNASGSVYMYPQVPQQQGQSAGPHVPPAAATGGGGGGLAIRVALKPAYRLGAPPQLSALGGEVATCPFQMDFSVEREVLEDLEQLGQFSREGGDNGGAQSGEQRQPLARSSQPTQQQQQPLPPSQQQQQQQQQVPNGTLSFAEEATPPVLSKYLARGMPREAVTIALANYGDNEGKIVDFCNSYERLREMGFPPEAVAEALTLCDNNPERAVVHLMQ